MPRSRRLDFPGAIHHVMNRGARKAPVFVDDEACAAFLDALALLPARFGVIIHAYALMPNHFHLVIETPRANLSEAMRFLTGTFTQALNRRHQWDGPIFRGRFRSRLIEDDGYMRHLLAYIHLNPVRAHLVPDADAANWTSHAAYVGMSKRPDWLTTDRMMKLYGSRAAYREYLDDVRVKRRAPPPGFADLWRYETEAQPRPAHPSIEDAVRAIEDVTGHPMDALRHDATITRPARWLAAWWLTTGAGASLAEAGAELGANRTNVWRMVRNARKNLSKPPFAAWVERLGPMPTG
jgi:REP element-mobilizing transposase RayT/DNA-directed RNA polymerase specialized sigma24 family protein